MPKILIIEDEADVVTLLVKRLVKSGFQTATASDVVEGIEMLRKEKPDLVILDLMLPAGGGATVLKSLRGDSQTSAIPVIILTASNSPGYKQKIMAEGVQAYMQKPYEASELMDTINALLKKK